MTTSKKCHVCKHTVYMYNRGATTVESTWSGIVHDLFILKTRIVKVQLCGRCGAEVRMAEVR